MIGRTEEIELLRDQADSDRSRFVVVYGRRRVGKTFLVREAFGYRFTFTHTGVEHVTMSEQLAQFRQSLVVQGYEECPVLTDWIEAFGHLKKLIMRSSDNRKVVFIDELPWMDTPKSRFLPAFENFGAYGRSADCLWQCDVLDGQEGLAEQGGAFQSGESDDLPSAVYAEAVRGLCAGGRSLDGASRARRGVHGFRRVALLLEPFGQALFAGTKHRSTLLYDGWRAGA